MRTFALALVMLVTVVAAAPAQAKTVHIRGTAYEFNNTRVLLRGATVRVVEDTHLRATVRADGTYDLAVPNKAEITPYITDSGYHSIYLQTFRTDGVDIDRVNFQTPTEAVYRGLAALLNVPLDQNGQLRDCAIVSTFSTRNVRDLSFRQFTAYGAHGVAGATAFTTPVLPPPIYFNEQVLPDPAQHSSSVDGGVIWTSVPAGVYTVQARHPSTRFASFVAKCAAGRIVNANPPWGLHELGRNMRATVTARWSVNGPRLQLRQLRVAKLPRGAKVELRCSGNGCPFGSVGLRSALARLPLELRAGQTLEAQVSAHAYNGKLVSWRLRAGRSPRPVTSCVPLGDRESRPRC